MSWQFLSCYKTENKKAIEGGTLSLLNIAKQEKENCQFVLCGPEKSNEMITRMNQEIERQTTESNGEENAKEVTDEMEKHFALVQYEVDSLRKEIELINQKITTARSETETQMNHGDIAEYENIKENIAVAKQRISELQYENPQD